MAANTNTQPNTQHDIDLNAAASETDNEIVKQLVQTNNTDVNLKDSNGYTPLHYAAYLGHHDIILLLNDPRTDVNIQNNEGNTPMHLACLSGRIEMIKALLKHHKIDVNTKNNDDMNPLHVAALKNNAAVVGVLIEDNRIMINATDHKYHNSALNWAAWSGETDVVKELLKHPGIDVNIQDNYGKTAIELATSYGHKETVEALIQHKKIKSNTAQKLAKAEGFTEIDKVIEDAKRTRAQQGIPYDESPDDSWWSWCAEKISALYSYVKEHSLMTTAIAAASILCVGVAIVGLWVVSDKLMHSHVASVELAQHSHVENIM
jgi:ankyrin repeat protein